MNRNYLFLWDYFTIHYFEMRLELVDNPVSKNQIRLVKDEYEGYRIDDVRLGSNQNLIVIILVKEDNPTFVITWDLQLKLEVNVNLATKKSFEIFWDYNGSPYIVEEGKVKFINQKCSFTSFQF